MHGFGIEEEMVRERLDRNLREAGERRLARMARRERTPSLRARMARRLFEAAVVMERDATWSVVWEKMEAPRRSLRSGE